MLWLFGVVSLVIWLVGKFLLHKGGFIHSLLVCAIIAFAIQFTQYRRAKEYERSLKQ